MAADFLEDETLMLEPGETTLYGIRLQNPDSEEVLVVVGLESEDNVATILNPQERYLLEAGTYDTELEFEISAPKDARPGTEYRIGYYMQPLSGTAGGIGLGLRLKRGFTAKISGDAAEQPLGGAENALKRIFLLAGALIFLLVLIISIAILRLKQTKLYKHQRHKLRRN